MIAYSIGRIKIKDAVTNTAILFIPMLLVLLIVILFPSLIRIEASADAQLGASHCAPR